MWKVLLNLLLIILSCSACSNHTPKISVVCEENGIGNCIIKWETTPVIEGKVKVYSSTDPDFIPENNPIVSTNINEQRLTIVPKNPAERYFYLMVFDNKYKIEVSTRNINIPGIQNFRDLGGYKNKQNQSVRWGMLYRSAQIDSINPCAFKELKNIGIRTIIDLRERSEQNYQPHLQNGFNIINIPITTGNMEQILSELQQEKIKSDTVFRIVKRMNQDLIRKHKKEYKQLFQILLNRNTYPAVIHCSSGKGRTGVAVALILSALEISSETIMEDYRLSNDFFNIPKASRFAYNLPVNSQEAITTLFSAQEDFLNAAKEEAEKEYGSIYAFLGKGLKLNTNDIKHLKNILLK